MKQTFEKVFRKFVLKVFKLTGSQWLYLFLLNIGTKLFYNIKNNIVYDKNNEVYWLKHANLFLLGVEQPYIYFSKKAFYNRCLNIFCQLYKPKKGDVIVDIGAGNGLELCFFSKMIGKEGKLYAIEANPSSFKQLCLLTEKNKFYNVEPINVAIADKKGTLWMELIDNYRVGKTNTHQNGIEVNALSLDDMVEGYDIKEIDFLKVNIEGAEYEMLDGMLKSISIIKNVAISCHDFLNARDQNIMLKVKDFLVLNGFKIYQRETGDLVLDSWIYGTRNY